MTLQEQIDAILELANNAYNDEKLVIHRNEEEFTIVPLSQCKSGYYKRLAYAGRREEALLICEMQNMAEIIRKQSEMLKVAKEALENYSGGSHTIAAKALATIEELDKL